MLLLEEVPATGELWLKDCCKALSLQVLSLWLQQTAELVSSPAALPRRQPGEVEGGQARRP